MIVYHACGHVDKQPCWVSEWLYEVLRTICMKALLVDSIGSHGQDGYAPMAGMPEIIIPARAWSPISPLFAP